MCSVYTKKMTKNSRVWTSLTLLMESVSFSWKKRARRMESNLMLWSKRSPMHNQSNCRNILYIYFFLWRRLYAFARFGMPNAWYGFYRMWIVKCGTEYVSFLDFVVFGNFAGWKRRQRQEKKKDRNRQSWLW